MGQKVMLMSATILDPHAFAESLGIDKNEYSVIKIPSPFPAENRPIFQSTIGSMSSSQIQYNLPKLKAAIEAILDEHDGQKGIIHCHTYKIARYLKHNLKSKKYAKRILMHNSDNRDEILKKHITTKQPTVLLSPSMTEGVDLKGDLSKFQVICKIPYPYLGDPIIKKRMNKNKGWYALQTAKSIVQSCGRSIRNESDQAVTYILDEDWHRFYGRNSNIFPEDFKKAIIK
jgi:Rad3-related DNA helicase